MNDSTLGWGVTRWFHKMKIWMMVEGDTLYMNFSWDTPSIRFTIKIFRYIYFAQLRHHQEDTDLKKVCYFKE